MADPGVPAPPLLAALVAILRSLPEAGTSLPALLGLCARELDPVFPAIRSVFAAIEAPRSALVVIAAGPASAKTLAVGDRLAILSREHEAALARGDCVVLDAGIDAFAGSGLALPLLADGALLAVWVVSPRSGSRFAPAEIGLLRQVGDALALAVGRARAVAAIPETTKALVEAERLATIGRLVAGVAHELGGPLQAIISLAEVLGRDPARDDRLEAANRILRSALRCRGMVQDLLAFARKEPPRLVPVKVEDALLDALELDRYSDVGEVQLTIEGHDALPPVLCDAGRLAQVFLNLVSNARQAVAATGRKGLVRVTLEEIDAGAARIPLRAGRSAVRVAVVDQGQGVAPDVKDRLFEAFATTKPPGRGSGLGLHVSRNIIHAMGGALYLDHAHEGPGARFVVEIPAVEGAARAEGEEPARRTRAKILLVDDDREVLETYEVILALDDHRVRSCDRAEKALRLLAEESFDAIVCDIRLPDHSGPEFLERLKSIAPAMVPKVIFATGDVVNDDTRAFLRSVPNPALIKPFQIDELCRAIDRVAGRGSG